jgi:DNA invertase Pin-like site-specific DNA recombinase
VTVSAALRLPALDLPEELLDRLRALAEVDGPPVVMYARISQDRTGAHLGADRQIDDMCGLAERRGARVVGVYVDNDLSAFSGKKRPDYDLMVAEMESGRVRGVLAWHNDRLYRPRGSELEDYIDVCESHNIPTWTVMAGDLDLTTSTGRMTARIIGAVARKESEHQAEKLRRQRQQLQEAGGHHGGRRRFGFEADNVTHRQAEADAIRYATNALLTNTNSEHGICRKWNSSGLTTSAGNSWSPSQLRQMLLRPCNAGLVGNTKGKIVGQATWDPIVDQETWRALCTLLANPDRRTNTGSISRKLLGSFLYSCECGALARSGGNSPTGQPRYTCAENHMRKLAEPVDQMVRLVVVKLLARLRGKLIPPTEDVTPLRQRLETLRQRQIELASILGDPDSMMTREQFVKANRPLKDEIDRLTEELARRSSLSALVGIADAPDPRAAFLAADIDRQRLVVDALVSVRLLRGAPGRQPDGTYFDPTKVEIKRKYLTVDERATKKAG